MTSRPSGGAARPVFQPPVPGLRPVIVNYQDPGFVEKESGTKSVPENSFHARGTSVRRIKRGRGRVDRPALCLVPAKPCVQVNAFLSQFGREARLGHEAAPRHAALRDVGICRHVDDRDRSRRRMPGHSQPVAPLPRSMSVTTHRPACPNCKARARLDLNRPPVRRSRTPRRPRRHRSGSKRRLRRRAQRNPGTSWQMPRPAIDLLLVETAARFSFVRSAADAAESLTGQLRYGSVQSKYLSRRE